MKGMQRREKGFTLVELLVVIAILVIIAAIIVPNISKFIGSGTEEAAKAERHNVQLAVTAAMAEGGWGMLAGNSTGNFGNTGQAQAPPYTGTDLLVYSVGSSTYYVGDYILGGAASVKGDYDVNAEGLVTLSWYPGLPGGLP